jgi:hypothetical protein
MNLQRLQVEKSLAYRVLGVVCNVTLEPAMTIPAPLPDGYFRILRQR